MRIKASLLEGTYTPSPVKRVEIPKESGGTRALGIPTVVDRVIQQAISQVLTPVFDPHFSEHSFGFRPNRSAHQAVRKVEKDLREGYRYAVDIDLEKFFDTVDHDVLMDRVSRRVSDKGLLRLLGSGPGVPATGGGRGEWGGQPADAGPWPRRPRPWRNPRRFRGRAHGGSSPRSSACSSCSPPRHSGCYTPGGPRRTRTSRRPSRNQVRRSSLDRRLRENPKRTRRSCLLLHRRRSLSRNGCFRNLGPRRGRGWERRNPRPPRRKARSNHPGGPRPPAPPQDVAPGAKRESPDGSEIIDWLLKQR